MGFESNRRVSPKHYSKKVKQFESSHHMNVEETLYPYLIPPFEPEISDKDIYTRRKSSQSTRKEINHCCKKVEEKYKTHMTFLTKNNQDLYESMKALSQ